MPSIGAGDPRGVEWIHDADGRPIALLVSAEFAPTATTFLTPPELDAQMGFVVYPAGGVVKRHRHPRREHRFESTPEALVVRSGRCVLQVYGEGDRLLASRELAAGDVALLLAGGHGITMLEPTVLLEVKTGSYEVTLGKELF